MTWWESWFGEEYLDLYPHRDVASARREAAFALAHLPARPTPLLDLCCGSGRHSLPLAQAGCPPGRARLLRAAPRPRAAAQRPPARSSAATCARSRSATAAFASVVNFFTSFGYFLGELENVAVVAEIERVLAARRRLPLRHLQPRLPPWRAWSPRSAAAAATASTASAAGGTARRRASRRRSRSAARARPRSSGRACAPTPADELVALLEGAGLAVEATWGDFDAAPVGPDSPRLIVARPQAAERACVIPFTTLPRPLAALPRFPEGASGVLPRSADARRRRERGAPAPRRARPGARARLGLPHAGRPKRPRMAEELAAGRAVAASAGHQVGLFTGPLFTLMKALDAMHLARELSRRGVPAVPVFWALTDDHDLQEIARTAQPGPEGPEELRARGRRPAEPPARRPSPDPGRRSAESSRRSGPTRRRRRPPRSSTPSRAAARRASPTARPSSRRCSIWSTPIPSWSSIRCPSRCARRPSRSFARRCARRRACARPWRRRAGAARGGGKAGPGAAARGLLLLHDRRGEGRRRIADARASRRAQARIESGEALAVGGRHNPAGPEVVSPPHGGRASSGRRRSRTTPRAFRSSRSSASPRPS